VVDEQPVVDVASANVSVSLSVELELEEHQEAVDNSSSDSRKLTSGGRRAPLIAGLFSRVLSGFWSALHAR
jgi:hypothetical protein